jgi:tetratricopeptide (TPR) repeat protein
VELARFLVTNYPSAGNWRDALIVFRTTGGAVEPTQNLDALRLMRAAGALAGERDYLAAAKAADEAGNGGEAKAIMEEGATRGMISGTDAASRALLTSATQRAGRERTALAGQITQARGAAGTAAQARTAADLLLGSGRYAEAAELYRLALTRTGEDPNLLNSRLGEALALAGQRAEAETALRAVTGPRAELASLWMAWLARRTS